MIESFQGVHRWLSNMSCVVIEFEGDYYPSTEHAYMAAKTLNLKERKPFQIGGDLVSPYEAKKAGRTVTLRDDWNDARDVVMTNIIAQKYSKTPYKELLDLTGDRELVEGNTWGDTYWGVCNGEGKNKLGKMIMAQRYVNRIM